MRNIALVALTGLGLAACQTTMDEDVTQNVEAPAWMAIVGKTIVNGDTKFVLNSNGSLVGTGIEGAWAERNGKLCRTLTKPEQRAGTECAVVTLNGEQVIFDNQQGRVSTWTVQ